MAFTYEQVRAVADTLDRERYNNTPLGEEQGRIHGPCYYQHPDNGEVCIAGAVIRELDPELFDDIVNDEDKNRLDIQSISGIADVFTFKALRFLTRLQERADFGLQWGEAIETVDEKKDTYSDEV